MLIYALNKDQSVLKGGATHCIEVLHTDVTAETTADTAKTLTNFAVKAGDIVRAVFAEILEEFSSSSGDALTSVLFDLGDGGDVDRLIDGVQVGSSATLNIVQSTNTQYQFTADDTVDVILTPATSGKNLGMLTAGKLHIYVQLLRFNPAT